MDQNNQGNFIQVHHEQAEWREPVEFIPQNGVDHQQNQVIESQEQVSEQKEGTQATAASVAGINIHIKGSKEYDASHGRGQVAHASSVSQKQIRSEGYAQVSGANVPEYRPAQDLNEQHIDIVQSTSTFNAQSEDVIVEAVSQEKEDIDRALYEKESKRIAEEHERNVRMHTEAYRRETEAQALKIREEFQIQHMKEQKFRRELAEATITRSKLEAALAYRAKLTELERTEQALRSAADQARLSSEIEVIINTAAGETTTGVSIDSKSELAQVEVNGSATKKEEVGSLGDRLKHFALGRP